MQDPVRLRKNRTDTSSRFSMAVSGAMIDATAYRGEVRMVSVHVAAPGSASMAGRMHDDLLPTDD